MMSERNAEQAENAYDIYETASSLKFIDENKCPYTGLPAAHLKIMNSSQVGLLTRIEKKLFFAQTRDFYAGILEKWILLYPSKSNDMKPSESFYPKSVDCEKGENQFNVLTNRGKRFHFQAPNSDEFNEWIRNIRKIIDDSDNCQLREKQPSQLSFRKLPSPPLCEENENPDSGSSSENYYGFNRSSNQTVINNEETLYEEPTRRSQEELREIPPNLPVKMGKKLQEDSTHAYDVPRPRKSIIEESPEIIVAFRSPSPSPEPIPITPEKSRTKVSEMTAILSSINLVSPEEKRKSAHVPKSKKISSPDKHEEKRISPMKSWFTKQIKRRVSKRDKPAEVMAEENEEPTTVKGSKVNMIISQLEKNGQLSKRLKNRKSAAFSEAEDYETVCVRN
jgi:PH domain